MCSIIWQGRSSSYIAVRLFVEIKQYPSSDVHAVHLSNTCFYLHMESSSLLKTITEGE